MSPRLDMRTYNDLVRELHEEYPVSVTLEDFGGTDRKRLSIGIEMVVSEVFDQTTLDQMEVPEAHDALLSLLSDLKNTVAKALKIGYDEPQQAEREPVEELVDEKGKDTTGEAVEDESRRHRYDRLSILEIVMRNRSALPTTDELDRMLNWVLGQD